MAQIFKKYYIYWASGWYYIGDQRKKIFEIGSKNVSKLWPLFNFHN